MGCTKVLGENTSRWREFDSAGMHATISIQGCTSRSVVAATGPHPVDLDLVHAGIFMRSWVTNHNRSYEVL